MAVNLAYRWFLGYDLDEETPNHSVLSKARRRFREGLFIELFSRVVEQCREAGSVDGTGLYVESTLVRADASGKPLVPVEEIARSQWDRLEETTEAEAGQFISQLFAHQMTPLKTPIAAEEWMSRYLPDPKLTGRLNRRVFPEFVAVTDEPGAEVCEGVDLIGHVAVDDEGVKCQDITLVEEGQLVMLPTGRQPTKKLTESNGHARTYPNQWTASGVTNLFVRTDKPKKDLVKELRKLAKDFDSEFGLLRGWRTRSSHGRTGGPRRARTPTIS